MGEFINNMGDGLDEFIPDDENNSIKPTTLLKIAAVIGGIAFFSYIVNKNFLEKKGVPKMGVGRILNPNTMVKDKTHTTIANTVIHEDGVPQIAEDAKIINVVPDEGRVLETEYNAGINEEVPKRPGRKFNFIYPGLDETPLYDTIDYLNDLVLSYKDKSAYPEPGNKHAVNVLQVYENFLSHGILPDGYEVVPSDD